MVAVMRFPSILTALCLLHLIYRSVDGQCSGSVNIIVGETPQTVSSANFPNNYPTNDRECEWRLTTEANYTDILMVHNVKQLSAGDKVEIFPGCDTSSPDKLINDSSDKDVLTDSNFTSPTCINFTVKAMSTSTGFQETFIAFPRTVAASVCQTSTKNAVTATTTPLYLYNPEFPAKYSPDQDCIWEIKNGGTGKDIILTFEIMSLEDCVDYVNVTAGGEINPTMYCLTDVFIRPFSIRNSSFIVTFHSDKVDGYRGFVVSYVLEEPCKGVLTALTGQPHLRYLSSIGYPSNYQSAVKSGAYSCTWQIDPNTAEGLLLLLTVDKLTDGDTLFIYEGTSDKTGTLLFPGQGDNYTDPCYFCNKRTTFVSVSSVYIEFNVSSSGNAGFNMGYLSQASSGACSANAESSPLPLMADDTLQYFSSPFFNSSNPGSDCYWNISDGNTGRGVILTVEFAYFGADCSDFLQITGKPMLPI
ncbi:CUB domain-containing protein 2 [Mizuhopecten yessoensis]|uniref:CUB domain-containing protein 2 n=1 Tax=Mizuhopecten yessoensis TaxID=6573 RepID=A0A210QMA3_MIZYE|nr:CUB domain-containing protein 2 [Mizuhopecten yessoensis]